MTGLHNVQYIDNVLYIELTESRRNTLIDIQQSTLDIYGYEELIKKTLRIDGYLLEDREWLNVIRRKWITHLKLNQK